MASLERSVSPNRPVAPNAAARHSRFFNNAAPMPMVIDRKPEFKIPAFGVKGIARFRDNALEPVDRHGCNEGETVITAHVGEMIEQRFRQLAHGTKETVVAGAGRQRAIVVLQLLRIARFDETNRHLLTAA